MALSSGKLNGRREGEGEQITNVKRDKMSAKGVKAVVPRSKEANKGPRRTNPWSIHPYRDAYTGVVVVVVPILGQAWVRGGGGGYFPSLICNTAPLFLFYFTFLNIVLSLLLYVYLSRCPLASTQY